MDLVKVKERALSVLLVLVSAMLVLGLVIHCLTYLGYDLRDHSQGLWWGLQLSSAFALIPGVVSTFPWDRVEPPKVQKHNAVETALLRCFGLFMLYAIFNFFFSVSFLNHGATPEIVNGKYALTSHGVARFITREEFSKHRVYEARANSGHWMFFYAMCLAVLYQKLWRRPGHDTAEVEEAT